MSAPPEHRVGSAGDGDGDGEEQSPGGTPPSVARPFSFAVSRALGTVVVTTHGVLDHNSARVLGDALVDLVDHQGNLAVIVDVADLHLSDHMCLVALARAASAADRRGGRLSFADPSEALARGLMLTGLAGMVTVTTAGRPRSHSAAPVTAADPFGSGDGRTTMTQHPAGSSTPPTTITTDRQGAAQ